MKHPVIMAGIILATQLPAPLAARQANPADSVAVLLRDLQRRLDSLEAVVRELRAAGRDTSNEADELSALRASAQAAVSGAEPVATTGGQSRTGSLQALNPEIGVTGDIVGTWAKPAGQAGNASAVAREFEFSFQSALDPYTRTKVFITRHEDFEIAGFEPPGHTAVDPADPNAAPAEEHVAGFEIEEGYLYWVGLPGGFGLKVGKFRQDLGLYNRWHTHALNEIEAPLAITMFTGEEGLAQTGASVALPSFTVGRATQNLTFEVARQSNEVLFEDGGDLSYLGRVQNFWDLGPEAYIQFGATGVTGSNDVLSNSLLGVDASFRWAPGGNPLYREFTLKGEWFFADREETGVTETGNGGYVQANLRADQRWVLGSRADIINTFAGENLLQLVPSLTYWQSEWVRMRLQYNLFRQRGEAANHTVLLQFVWAMGPHKHETY